jgi:hypothetical protein
MSCRGVINGKAGKADMLTLSQWGRGVDYAQPLALPHLHFFVIMPLSCLLFFLVKECKY